MRDGILHIGIILIIAVNIITIWIGAKDVRALRRETGDNSLATRILGLGFLSFLWRDLPWNRSGNHG